MTIEQSIKRLYWRFGKGVFTPNKEDVDALNHITDWINDQKTAVLQHDVHFAKLYCHIFSQEVVFYKGNIKLAQAKMREYLEKNLPSHYNDFGQCLNDAILNDFRNKIGLSDKHPVSQSDQERQEEEKIIAKNMEYLEKYFLGVWEQDKIDKSLNSEISEAIHKYRNKP